MAREEEIRIKINIDTGDGKKASDSIKNGLKDIQDGARKAESSAKKAGGAFASIGNALKSLGIISLVVKGFEFLQEILMKNQKVADAFAVAGEFISRVLSDLVEFVVNNFGKVVDLFTKVFNDPLLYVEKLGEAIKNNLIERVKSLIDAYGFLGEIIKNVFTGEFDAAAEAAKNFGKEVVDVFTGVDDAFDKGVEVVKNATAAIVEYGKETLEAAKKGVALRNSARLAASEAEVAAAKFKRQAEEQRQIRDNEFASLEDRIAANQRLGKILEQQLKQEERAAELAVAAARYEFNKTKSLDDQIALNQALAALEGKREEITGQRSEQLVNEIALTKELQELNKTRIAAENKLDIDARKAAADRIKDEKEKLEVKRQIAVDEAAIELKRLEDNVNAATEGTTARVAAEIEYKEKKAAIANEIISIDENIEKVTIDRAMAAAERQIADAEKLQEDIFRQFDIKRDAYDQEQALLQESLDKNLISQQEFNDKYKALSDARIRIDEEEKQARINAAMAAADVLGKLASIIGEQTAAGKALGIAQATINTYTGATQALNSKVFAPEPFATAIRVAQAAVIVASGIKSIREIAKVKVQGQAGSGGVSLPSLSAAAPITPQAALPTVTQLDNQTINRMGSATNRAYVLESDINNNQERLIRITRAARLG